MSFFSLSNNCKVRGLLILACSELHLVPGGFSAIDADSSEHGFCCGCIGLERIRLEDAK